MKKLIGFIIAGLIVAGLGVGIFFMIKNHNDNKEFSLKVETSVGGYVDVTFDDTIDRVINGVASTYTIKNKTKVVFSQTTSNNYIFTGWFIDGIACGTDATLTLNITDNTLVTAKFEEKKVTLTINDSADQTFNETTEFKLNKNLLNYLNSKYIAPKGYAYSYTYNSQPVTSSTTLTSAATITRTKYLVEYSITYKLPDGYTFDGTNNTKDVTYTIENVNSITSPSLPTAKKHYTLAWNNTINETNFDAVSNITAIETAIEYHVTFTLSEGTFDGTNSSVVKNLTILDMSYPTTPDTDEHYEYAWNTTITADNLDSVTTVTATIAPIEYTVTYKLPEGITFDGTNNTKEVVYTIENVGSTTVPEFPTVEHFNLAWDNVITAENLGTINTINAIQTAKIYTVTFKHNGEEVKSINYSSDNPIIEPTDIPNPPTSTSEYFYIWEDYSSKLATMGNFDINSQALAKISVSTSFEDDLTVQDLNALFTTICYNKVNQKVYSCTANAITEIGSIEDFANALINAGKEDVILTKVNDITEISTETVKEKLTTEIGTGETVKTITLSYGLGE